jgi:hypothetical protein
MAELGTLCGIALGVGLYYLCELIVKIIGKIFGY